MEADRHEGRWQTRLRGRPRLIFRPLSRTGENPPYGILGEAMETSASFEARSAPLSHPTVSSARTDLCGGRPATTVPTATRFLPSLEGLIFFFAAILSLHAAFFIVVCGVGMVSSAQYSGSSGTYTRTTHFHCPNCKTEIKPFDLPLRGQGKCRTCGTIFRV